MLSEEKQAMSEMEKKEIKAKDNITETSGTDFKNNSAESEKDINYWQSFRDLYKDPDFLKEKRSEFSQGVLDKPGEDSFTKFSRRKFLALLSASAAVAAAGCSNYREKGELVPYNKKPEEVTIGNPNYYASTCSGCSHACGILIKTLEGRPIKVDGNPDHPVSKGKICAIGQASVMNLYDPERLKNPADRTDRSNSKDASWADVNGKIISQLRSASSGGKEIAIIANTINSPSQKKLLDDFKTAYPTSKVYSYELFNESRRNSAWEKCYGSKMYPLIQWDKAKVILALESDFLGTEGNKVENLRLYTENRDALNGKDFNRLYAVEGNTSVTGMNADYRLILRTDAMEEFVMCLLNEFLSKEKISVWASDPGITSKLSQYNLEEFAGKNNLSKEVIEHLISDLKKNQGSSYISAGSALPESTHIAVNLLNEVLGNANLYSKEITEVEFIPLSSKQEIENLVSDIQSGNVGAVIHFDSNPVYHFPKDYGYAEALKNVPLVITMTEGENESGELSHFILPINTMFESWGDYQTRNNFVSLQQPVIAPLYNTRQKEAILLTWIKGNEESYADDVYQQYVMDNWRGTVLSGAGSEQQFMKEWFAGLNDGVVILPKTSSSGENSEPAFKPESFSTNNTMMSPEGDFVLILTRNNSLGDGRYANNGWLQELPKPISRVAWDNFAAISVQTSKVLGLKQNDQHKHYHTGRKAGNTCVCAAGCCRRIDCRRAWLRKKRLRNSRKGCWI